MIKNAKLTAAVLMTVLGVSLAACGNKSGSDASTDLPIGTNAVNSENGADTLQTGQNITGIPGGEGGDSMVSTDMVNPSLTGTTAPLQLSGIKNNSHYENILFNVYADIPDTYVIYSEEDLGQEYETQDELKEALDTGKVNYMDLVAQDTVTSENIQIMISHVSSLTDKGRAPDEWLVSSMDSFKKKLAAQGAQEIAAEIVPVRFAGEEVQSIHMSCVMSEKQIEQQFIYKTAGDYVMLIAVSAAQDRAPALLGYFYGG